MFHLTIEIVRSPLKVVTTHKISYYISEISYCMQDQISQQQKKDPCLVWMLFLKHASFLQDLNIIYEVSQDLVSHSLRIILFVRSTFSTRNGRPTLSFNVVSAATQNSSNEQHQTAVTWKHIRLEIWFFYGSVFSK
jgi:hypothetical protein